MDAETGWSRTVRSWLWFGGGVALGASLLATPLLAQEEFVNKFLIRLGTITVGTEEYRIEKNAEGYELASKIPLHELTSSPLIAIQHQQLAPDWSLTRYTLQVSIPGQRRTIKAWREGEKIQIRVISDDNTRSRAIEFRPHTIVLDSLVASHYQILLDQHTRMKGNEDWWVLVPQNLGAVAGKLSAGGETAGTLTGKPIPVCKHTLRYGQLTAEIWSEAGTNRLMRVFEPRQELEMVREGFELRQTR